MEQMSLEYNEHDFTTVKNIEIPDIFFRRYQTGIESIDYLFGNGILPGFTFTLAAPPGAGKSTWMLQLTDILSKQGLKCGYCTGEESVYQIAYTSKRLNVTEVEVCNKTDVDEICEATKQYKFLVIDSFQSLTTRENIGTREMEHTACQKIVRHAKENECVVCFIMHMTKANKMRGSMVIPHTVDGNLNIELDPEAGPTYRKVYFTKNRFGPPIEIFMHLRGTGYEWPTLTEVREHCRNDIIPITETKRTPKEILKQKILAHGNQITIQEACRTYLSGDLFKTMCIMRELTVSGKMEKVGRGQDAYWVKIGT